MKNRSKLKKYHWRLAFAKQSTNEVKTACDFLLQFAPKLNQAVYSVLVTGIMVRYARPFGNNSAVGSLPKKFAQFVDQKLQKTHDLIIFSRNNFFAHSDALADYEDEVGRKHQLLSLAIVAKFEDEEIATIRSQITEPVLMLPVIADIKTLCGELIKKLDLEERLLMEKLYTDTAIREGKNPINIFDES